MKEMNEFVKFMLFSKKEKREKPVHKQITVEEQRYSEPAEKFASKLQERISATKDYGELDADAKKRVFDAIVAAKYTSNYYVDQSVILKTIGEVLGKKPLPSVAAEPVVKKVVAEESTPSEGEEQSKVA